MNKDYLIYKLADRVKGVSRIDSALFPKYGVKRGLRNEDGSGVLVGLTKVGNVVGYQREEDGSLTPVEGKLFYRGYELNDLVAPLRKEKRLGFEEVAYLLLSGDLPDREELDSFRELLNSKMPLDHRSLVHIIDLEGSNIMNILARCVLEMYTFDDNPEDLSRDNLMRQSIDLIAKFPTIIAYAYNCYRHSVQGRGLHIRHPQENLSLAENFLFMLKGDFTPLEAQMLDLLLITQAEHGGANIMVADMFQHLREVIRDWTDTEEIDAYLNRMLDKEAYDQTGLIYGLGHAVYTISDPRAVNLKEQARRLAEEKGRMKEYEFLCRIEERGLACIRARRSTQRPICANLDFFSGFIYEMIGIPRELYTPIFAMSRIVGWCAHRIEELNFDDRRIIRPAYLNVAGPRTYAPLSKR